MKFVFLLIALSSSSCLVVLSALFPLPPSALVSRYRSESNGGMKREEAFLAAMKEHKTNKDSTEEKYSILIEILFFNFHLRCGEFLRRLTAYRASEKHENFVVEIENSASATREELRETLIAIVTLRLFHNFIIYS